MRIFTHYSDAKASSRQRTPEGLLRAKATVTRAGMFEYDAGELGVGSPGDTVRMQRTMETIKHPDTLNSIRGAAVTLEHPPADVSPETWGQYVVGNIVGEPKVDATGLVRADILVGREDAIKAVEAGTHELSVGYTFKTKRDRTGKLLTSGPLVVNHVAIVERGRAGPRVRIQDQQETTLDQAAVDAAVEKAIAKVAGSQKGVDSSSLKSALKDAMGPVLETVDAMNKSMKKRMEEEEKDRKMKEAADAKAAAQKAADELVAQTIKDRDAYHDVINDALPLIAEDKRAELKGKPAKDYLVAALTPTLPNAAQLDEAVLQGALMALKAKGADSTGTPWPAGVTGNPAAPGMNGTQQGQDLSHTASDAVTKARDAYIKNMTTAYKTAGERGQAAE